MVRKNIYFCEKLKNKSRDVGDVLLLFFIKKFSLSGGKKKIHKKIKEDVGYLLIIKSIRWKSFYYISQLIF